ESCRQNFQVSQKERIKMPSSFNPRHGISTRILSACFVMLVCVTAAMSQAQSNAAANLSREATANDDGFYKIVNLPPGIYEVRVKANNYKTAILPSVPLSVGQTVTQDVPLEVGDISATVTVSSAAPSLVETSGTSVASTINQERINDLPINERSATGFALTISTVGRDNGRPIGPAPTSGLNIGGQRGRSTLVQVDGADYTDNSI